jgi:hypothetical protein
MKNLTKLLGIIALAAVIGFSFTACNDKPEERTAPNPVTITQGPNGLAFAGKVTIKSSDTYTSAQWDATVKKVITALNAAYEGATGPSQTRFRTMFGYTIDEYGRGNGEIVLVNNLTNNWEVKNGEFNTLYLKTGSIATANYSSAVANMTAQNSEVGNATPPQRGVFLAKVLGTKNGMYAI